MALAAIFLTIAMACRADSDTCNFNDGAINCFWPLVEISDLFSPPSAVRSEAEPGRFLCVLAANDPERNLEQICHRFQIAARSPPITKASNFSQDALRLTNSGTSKGSIGTRNLGNMALFFRGFLPGFVHTVSSGRYLYRCLGRVRNCRDQ